MQDDGGEECISYKPKTALQLQCKPTDMLLSRDRCCNNSGTACWLPAVMSGLPGHDLPGSTLYLP